MAGNLLIEMLDKKKKKLPGLPGGSLRDGGNELSSKGSAVGDDESSETAPDSESAEGESGSDGGYSVAFDAFADAAGISPDNRDAAMSALKEFVMACK